MTTARDRAAVRWLLANKRRRSPCGCTFVEDATEEIGARRVFACLVHRARYKAT